MLSDDNEEHISDNEPLTTRKHRATRKKRKRGSFKRFCADASSVVALLKATFQVLKLFWDFFLH